jgi:tetratricopeptide (TPR) repeat protein
VFAGVERSGQAAVHRLQRLDRGHVAELVDAARPGRTNDELQRRLHAETEGLPFLLVEYLRVLDPDADGVGSLPDGARDLFRSRLDPVSETARQVLSAAAVLGRSFDVTTVRVTSGRTDDETVAALEELTDHGLVREATSDYDFTHEKLRAMVYADTSLARRRLLHARAAATAHDAVTAARHLQLAGDEAAAAAAYVRAADQARSVFAHPEAVGHLRSALALGHPDASALHAAIGALQTLTGDYAAALGRYEMAAATAGAADLAGIEHSLGQLHHRRGDWGLAAAHLGAALHATPSVDEGTRARITADLSLAAHDGGQAERAVELARQAYDLAVSADDLHALAQAENLLGLLASSTDRTAEAIVHLESSLALAERVDDPSARIAALNNLALAHRARGETDAAVALTREALDRCAVLGDRHREAALHNNLADLLHAAGAPEEAMQHLKSAVATFAEIGADDGPQPEIWKLVRW